MMNQLISTDWDEYSRTRQERVLLLSVILIVTVTIAVLTH